MFTEKDEHIVPEVDEDELAEQQHKKQEKTRLLKVKKLIQKKKEDGAKPLKSSLKKNAKALKGLKGAKNAKKTKKAK